MFGYVTTDFINLIVKDTLLYKATYCGLCKSIARACGTRGRFLLNYDLTFLSVFLHNVTGKDVQIERQHCILHPISKRPVAVPDELSVRIAALNVILAYYKLTDDVTDTGRGRIKRSVFKKAYKRAKKSEPILDGIVKTGYDTLLGLERAGSDVIDAAAEPFGNMMREICKELTGDKFNENLSDLFYNLGKWIYLIDAVDDFDKDKAKGSFNVFVNAYKDAEDKNAFLSDKKADLQFLFGEMLSAIYDLGQKVQYNFNHDLTDNILFKGIFMQTKNVLEGKKCRNTIKF